MADEKLVNTVPFGLKCGTLPLGFIEGGGHHVFLTLHRIYVNNAL